MGPEKQLGPLRDQLGRCKQAAGARYGDEGKEVSERLDLIELWHRARLVRRVSDLVS